MEVTLDNCKAHYLRNVLRLKSGDGVLAFNGKDGEWQATLADGKRAALALQEQTRPQTEPQDLHYLFAPLKHERLDYMVQKAVEMGVSRLQPVLTHHTQVHRVNLARIRANAIEAAEQCGVLSIPEIAEPVTFARAIAARSPDRLLVFCDEDADVKDPVAALAAARLAPSSMLPLTMANTDAPQPLAVLIGPEGGFADDERAALLQQPNSCGYRSGRGCCAPTPRQWRRWRWSKRCWVTGGDARVPDAVQRERHSRRLAAA